MSGGSIPSVEIGQVWSYTRDCLRGTTPLAQYQIECLQRDYLPPSKAHLKRLAKARPFVLKARPAKSIDQSPRRAFVDAHHTSLEVQRMANRAAHGLNLLSPPKAPAPVRVDFTQNATVPKADDDWSVEAIDARIAKLAREAEQARLDVERVKNAK